MLKKIMISQPMAGKTEYEITETRERAMKFAEENGYEFVNTLFTDEWYSKEAMEQRRNGSKKRLSIFWQTVQL